MQWDKSERNTSEKSTFSNLPKLEGEPPQIGGSTVSRSRGLENNFFLLLKPFSENSHTGDSKNVRFFSLEPFLAEKTAVKEKKARFDPFVPPTHFQQQVGWGTRLVTWPLASSRTTTWRWHCIVGIVVVVVVLPSLCG